MGLIVDVPKPGFGSTNDGNTARRAFQNAPTFSLVTGIKQDLIERFHNILICISCELPLDPIRFGNYCKETAELYMFEYSWYPMPATVHKVTLCVHFHLHYAVKFQLNRMSTKILGPNSCEADYCKLSSTTWNVQRASFGIQKQAL